MSYDLENQSIKIEGGVDDGARRSVLSQELVTRIVDDVRTPYEGFLRTAKNSGDRPCLGTRGGPDNKYQWITYAQVNERATNLGSGLVHLGCKPSQSTFVGIYGPNCVEWDLADLACQMHSMISVPIYDTHGAEGCIYIINHADIETIICNGSKLRFLFDNAKQCEELKRIIKIDGPVTEEEKKEAESFGIKILNILEVEQMGTNSPHQKTPGKPEDIMTICYTSGTTGTPKGVMMTNGNINSVIAGVQMQYEAAGIHMHENDCMISYLPLAHMYERLAQALCFFNGMRIGFFQGDVKLLLSDIQELKPTVFPSVPRLLTRVYDKVMAQVSQSKFKSWIFHKALSSKEADLKKFVSTTTGLLILERFSFECRKLIGHFRVTLCLCFKASLCTKPLTLSDFKPKRTGYWAVNCGISNN